MELGHDMDPKDSSFVSYTTIFGNSNNIGGLARSLKRSPTRNLAAKVAQRLAEWPRVTLVTHVTDPRDTNGNTVTLCYSHLRSNRHVVT